MNKIKNKLAFGCMRLPMIGDQVDETEFCKMIDRFIESGFNYFDTAHGYLDGKSELALRSCLTSRYPRENYLLTNKLTDTYFNKQEEKPEENIQNEIQEETKTKPSNLRLGISNLDNLNPILSKNQNIQDISKLVYEPLFNPVTVTFVV